jgi:hypothetical protein
VGVRIVGIGEWGVGEGLRLSEYVMCVGGFEEDGFVTRVRRVYGTMCVCVCVCVEISVFVRKRGEIVGTRHCLGATWPDLAR